MYKADVIVPSLGYLTELQEAYVSAHEGYVGTPQKACVAGRRLQKVPFRSEGIQARQLAISPASLPKRKGHFSAAGT